MAKRSNRIVQPGDEEFVQMGLFSEASKHGEDFKVKDFPPVYRSVDGFKKVLAGADKMVGIDFEFQPDLRPTVMGISNDTECAAVFYDKELHQFLETERERRGLVYSGHAVLTADREVHEKALGVKTPRTAWSDSMLTFWLANADLCKNPGKEDDGDGGLGFMGLGTLASLTTDLPHHKTCRGRWCEEVICSRHDVRGYCAVDAYTGLRGDIVSRRLLDGYGVPTRTIEDLHDLQELSKEMSDLGVAVDRKYVATLGDKMKAEQDKLFPAATEEGYVFNPRSPKEIVEWAKSNSLFLGKTDKDAVSVVLEKLAAGEGYTGDSLADVTTQLDSSLETLEPVLATIYKLYQYKVLGKGTDSWFHDRYFGADGLLHPRFLVTGTSTGRYSSTRPNYQNIPKRGWGKQVRKAFVPRDESLLLVEADFCVDPSTKILKTDLSWVPAGDLREDDDLIGFDETPNGHAGQKFRPSKVLSTKRIVRPCFQINTTQGSLVCSAEHKVIIRRKKTSGGDAVRGWVEAKDIRVGDHMAFTHKPWSAEDSYRSGFIAGAYEGEGWVSGRHCGIGQGWGKPLIPVLREYLKDDGLRLSGGEGGKKTIVQRGKEYVGVEKVQTANLWDSLHLLGKHRPPRLLANSEKLWNGARTWGKLTNSAVVTSVEYLGDREVVALETSTKTYISNGFLSHNCQLELRVILYLAGIDPAIMGADAFTWLVTKADGMFEKAAERYGGTARDIAKSVSHGGNYGEGLRLIDPAELDYSRVKREIDAGALLVYKDWLFQGKVVAFTGSNLAQRLFGNKTLASRKKALEVQEIYFKNFPVRAWQRKAMAESESRGYVQQQHTGRFLRLNDTPEKNAKLILAFLGQGVGAVHTQSVMLQYKRRHGTTFLGSIHDALLTEVPKVGGYRKIYEFMKEMEHETPILTGFTVPCKIEVGSNWGEMRSLDMHEGDPYLGHYDKKTGLFLPEEKVK